MHFVEGCAHTSAKYCSWIPDRKVQRFLKMKQLTMALKLTKSYLIQSKQKIFVGGGRLNLNCWTQATVDQLTLGELASQDQFQLTNHLRCTRWF